MGENGGIQGQGHCPWLNFAYFKVIFNTYFVYHFIFLKYFAFKFIYIRLKIAFCQSIYF